MERGKAHILMPDPIETVTPARRDMKTRRSDRDAHMPSLRCDAQMFSYACVNAYQDPGVKRRREEDLRFRRGGAIDMIAPLGFSIFRRKRRFLTTIS